MFSSGERRASKTEVHPGIAVPLDVRLTVLVGMGGPAGPSVAVKVTPCRVYDSRASHGGTGPIQGGTSQDFNLPQLSQSGPCASNGTTICSARWIIPA
jgi:hypothetical protein